MKRSIRTVLIAVILLAALVGALGPSLVCRRSPAREEFALSLTDVPGQLETELLATLTVAPDEPTALLALADLYAHSGRIQEAIPLFERAITLRPDLVAARLSFARALLANGLVTDAEAQLEAALALAPQDPQILYLLGQAAELRQPPNLDDARAWYQRAAEADDDPYARLARRRLEELSSRP
ncbi:MAG: tetratricopeptide repeat protein [Thermomicrobium sp.]|nr:tetratricopeptide repeat protein [Thermomicrobium sp.]